jgi:hypothetical protein
MLEMSGQLHDCKCIGQGFAQASQGLPCGVNAKSFFSAFCDEHPANLMGGMRDARAGARRV